MVLYLAEQYWPDVTRERLRAAVGAMLAHGDGTDAAGSVVAVLFTPHDECVFYLLHGRSAAAAGDLVARTGRPADRVQPCERIDRRLDEPFRSDQGQALGDDGRAAGPAADGEAARVALLRSEAVSAGGGHHPVAPELRSPPIVSPPPGVPAAPREGH